MEFLSVRQRGTDGGSSSRPAPSQISNGHIKKQGSGTLLNSMFVLRILRWGVKPALAAGAIGVYAAYDTHDVVWIDQYDVPLKSSFDGKATVLDACQQQVRGRIALLERGNFVFSLSFPYFKMCHSSVLQVPLSQLATLGKVRGEKNNPIVRCQCPQSHYSI